MLYSNSYIPVGKVEGVGEPPAKKGRAEPTYTKVIYTYSYRKIDIHIER